MEFCFTTQEYSEFCFMKQEYSNLIKHLLLRLATDTSIDNRNYDSNDNKKSKLEEYKKNA